jgi:hypothetical protein
LIGLTVIQPSPKAYGGHAQSILETRADVADVKAGLSEQAENVKQILAVVTSGNLVAPAAPKIDDILGPEIDRFRDLLTSNQATLALGLLEDLRVAHWERASDRTKYRILTNIAVAKTNLSRPEGADDHIAALCYDRRMPIVFGVARRAHRRPQGHRPPCVRTDRHGR